MNNIAFTLLLFSGFSALTYQVVWVRLLGLSIGTTSAAVGVVIGAIFLGMAIGSWLSGRIPPHWQRGLKTFAIVEATIGISALLLLPVLLNLDHFMALLPNLGGALWFRFMSTTLLLAVPAAGLGAAYPLIAAAIISQQKEMGPKLGLLYAMHTTGAVIGALASAFILIPWLGLDGAIYTAVAINFLIALSAYFLTQNEKIPSRLKNTQHHNESPGSTKGAVVLAITGLSSVALEIGWVKYLAIYTESTFASFALLLAIFLSGIAIGSWLIKRMVWRIRSIQKWLAFGLSALTIAMFLTRYGLGIIPDVDNYFEMMKLEEGYTSIIRYGLILFVLYPTALIFGALFPLSIHCYCGSLNSLSRRVGEGYAINTIAGLVGAVATALWLIPSYGTDHLLIIIALLTAATALMLMPAINQTKIRLLLTITIILTALIGSTTPGIDYKKMLLCMECSEGAYRQGGKPEFLYLKESKTGVVSLVTYDGKNIILENNGLQESRITPKRPNKSEVLLGVLPHIFKPNAKRAFVLGYGGGMTTEVLAATPLSFIKVVELEPAIVEAMASFKKEGISVLKDPRIKLEFNDARNSLLMDSQKYDLIISQPSHPWRAGSTNVFSKEFFKIVHSRLEKGGVFTQWINLTRMDSATLKALFKAFFEEFPEGAVFSNTQAPDLLFIGTDEKLVLDSDIVK
ncbi:MAG: fused MFS/spermidine synthase, partial [Chromatiales bacterium]|nr:fused MFS/spermidine synthase [Chromatiales bacterium]